ncbi:short chain dehydrogenase [Nesidiocoris tenuis]|uniref:Short chain dehydrogenase n=1 Tax=Nesidiocoris tenuis TaxID=355587 RepID=A0ABN7AN60_9HEMI|nr:short chain dehydrogenase [Nesidiocoris tenuis]
MIDDQTAVVLAVQLTALCCIAGSLLLYLLCKVKRGASWATASDEGEVGTGRSVLVTCVQNQLGLQLALRLAGAGFRVFAGLRDGNLECDAARVIKAKLKAVEAAGGGRQGAVILIPLDVTREDSLHEGVDHIRRHLPAGQNGLWAVINTAGVAVKGRLESQESCQWDSMFKINVVGTLRSARALLPLIRVTQGRFVTVGLSSECQKGTTGVVAYAAARHAVLGASSALANELAHLGVSVVVINTGSITAEQLYHGVKVTADRAVDGATPSDAYLNYNVNRLPEYAVKSIEETLLVARPKQSYDLRPPVKLSNYLTALTTRFNPAAYKPHGKPDLTTV